MKRTSGHLYKRGQVYYLRWMVDGQVYNRSTGAHNKRDAENFRDKLMQKMQGQTEVEILSNVAAGIEGRRAELAALDEQENPPLTIAKAWGAFVRSQRRNDCSERTLDDYAGYFTRFEKWMTNHHPKKLAMRDVTEEIAAAYMNSITDAGRSAGTYNKHRDFLKGMFSTLRKEAKMTVNPFDGITRRTDNQHSRRELTTDEIRKVCQAAAGELRTLFAIGIYTGLRLGDVATLKWHEVDMTRGRITRVPNKTARKKPGKVVLIPIHPVLHDILSETPPGERGEYVLPKMAEQYHRAPPTLTRQIQAHFEHNGIKTQEKRKDQKAVTIVGFHSLRHNFVSLCRDANAPLAVVEAIVGHSNPAMTRHYTHTSEQAAGLAVNGLPSLIGDVAKALPEPEPVDLAHVRELVEQLNGRNWKKIKSELFEILNMKHEPA
ncbi:MAG: hypothetical protein EOM20_11775 [Spartobacteria bacterium]|nr:hypothetical protein [Spartobacteria bacterium]